MSDMRAEAEKALGKLLEAMRAELAEKRKQKRKLDSEVSKLDDDVERISLVLKSVSADEASVVGLEEGEDLSNLSVTKGAYIILRSTGKPLHVNEIAERLQRAGKAMKAKNLYNMIYTVLKRDPKFIVTGPGTFGLREWVLSEF